MCHHGRAGRQAPRRAPCAFGARAARSERSWKFVSGLLRLALARVDFRDGRARGVCVSSAYVAFRAAARLGLRLRPWGSCAPCAPTGPLRCFFGPRRSCPARNRSARVAMSYSRCIARADLRSANAATARSVARPPAMTVSGAPMRSARTPATRLPNGAIPKKAIV